MNNFSIIYKILKYFEKAMDYDEADINQVSAEMLGISQNRWINIMSMLIENGYLSGMSIKQNIMGDSVISVSNPCITLKGLEYLNENSLMKKAANIAKGIIDINIIFSTLRRFLFLQEVLFYASVKKQCQI